MIRFEALEKRYGERRAVFGLDLEVRAGEVVALLGPNGSGKTTSLKCAAGLLRPTRGRVLVGEPPAPAHEAAARRAIAFLPQKVAFPDALTGREVLEFHRRLRGASGGRVAEVLEQTELTAAANRPVATYSGGMVQRLGLGVVALAEAPALLLDEPTASLDQAGVAAFYQLAEQRRARGLTLLFSSHQRDDVERLAERVAVLIDGRLAAVLGRAELLDRLSERGRMQVRFSGSLNGLAGRLPGLAPGATVSAGCIDVPGSPAARARALEAIRGAGISIVGLSSEEGRLDELYRELSGGAK